VVALVNLGRLYSAKKDRKHALMLYQMAVDIAPYDPDAHNNLGSILAKSGDMKSAELHFNKAVQLNSQMIPAWENLMRIFMLKHDWTNAQKSIYEILKKVPHHPTASLNQAKIYLHKKQFKMCIEYLKYIKQWLENNSDVENFFGVAYAGIGDENKARSHFKKAVSLNPDNGLAQQNLLRSAVK
jgi:Flp pilus assembly protein TadD